MEWVQWWDGQRYALSDAIRWVLWLGVTLGLAAFLIVNFGVIGSALSGESPSEFESAATTPYSEREPITDERGGITVFTSHLREEGSLTAISSDGRVQYHNDSYHGYWDVDKVSETESTVIYSATDTVEKGDSGCVDSACTRQIVEKANLTTGDTEKLYSHLDPKSSGNEWHDIDRLDDSTLLVADMEESRVMQLNLSTGLVEWQWEAQNYYRPSGGGRFPSDWTHLNDVERLEDGRTMVSIRNFDEVIFLHKNGTVDESWTLGETGEHDIVHAQHNPDYIPEENGGPAVIIADSENDRLVEYQRTSDGGWSKTWEWEDAQVSWPRDADRLPNGNTLISDSHGGRVAEIAPNGSVVWEVSVDSVYEAERLSTGDESTGGQAAAEINLSSNSVSASKISTRQQVGRSIRGLFPPIVVHGVLAITPPWVGFVDALIMAGTLLCGILIIPLEIHHRGYGLRFPLQRKY